MPIRFQCPNGHALQVGEELAGKRGACPECGAKVEVPQAGPTKAGPTKAGPAAPQAVAPSKEGQQQPATKPAANPAAKPVAKAVAKPVAKPVAKSPPVAGDAWYLRTPAGEQFGPAAGEQFSEWIREQRVGPTSYVWHEGWPEWRLAADVADQLPAPLVGARPSGSTTGFATPPVKRSASSRYMQKKRMWIRLRLLAAAALLLLTLVLGGILVWVLVFKPGQSGNAPEPEAPTQSEPAPAAPNQPAEGDGENRDGAMDEQPPMQDSQPDADSDETMRAAEDETML